MAIRIALDAMGGDNGVLAVIGGMDRYFSTHPSIASDVFFNIYGDTQEIEKVLKKDASIPNSKYKIIHTKNIIPGDMKPSYALRYGRGSSMFEAIHSISIGQSDAVVSSGNTGAYMALSKSLLKMIPGVDRPALVSLIPTAHGTRNVMLDLGANTECDAFNLFQFAIMGNAVAKAVLNLENPRIGLLNVGTEKTKGTQCLKMAYDLIFDHFGNSFVGFVEGSDITNNAADVIVSDGFSGNIALKTIEGTFKFIANLYKNNVTRNMWGKFSYLVSKPILNRIWGVVDPRKHNGASLVGLNGIAIKSHGNADAVSFSSAISVAVRLAGADFVANIRNFMDK